MCRTCALPVLVMENRLVLSPVLDSEGTRPIAAISCGAVAKRRRSPSSDRIVIAESVSIPRSTVSAATYGCVLGLLRGQLDLARHTAPRCSIRCSCATIISSSTKLAVLAFELDLASATPRTACVHAVSPRDSDVRSEAEAWMI